MVNLTLSSISAGLRYAHANSLIVNTANEHQRAEALSSMPALHAASRLSPNRNSDYTVTNTASTAHTCRLTQKFGSTGEIEML